MAILAFVMTIIVGVFGLFLDFFVLHFQGYLCLILTIATIGAFIIYTIEKVHKK